MTRMDQIMPCAFCLASVQPMTFGVGARSGMLVMIGKGFGISYGRATQALCHDCFLCLSNHQIPAGLDRAAVVDRLTASSGGLPLSRPSWAVMARCHGMTLRTLKKRTSAEIRRKRTSERRKLGSHCRHWPLNPMLAMIFGMGALAGMAYMLFCGARRAA